MEHNFIENNILIFSKETMDMFFKQENPAELIALYSLYYYTAKWQKTNQIKASISYAAKGLKWGDKKVRHYKKILISLGLISDVKQVNKETKKVTGWYVKINYIWKQENQPKVIHSEQENHPTQNGQGGEKIGLKTTLPISHSVDSNHPNALSVGNKMLNTVNGVVKGGNKDEGTEIPTPADNPHFVEEKHEGSFLRKLADLDIEDGEKEYLVGEILAVLKDKKSKEYYQLVASKIQPDIILRMLAEVNKDIGVMNPAKLFTYKIEQYVLLHRSAMVKNSGVLMPDYVRG